jgi:hypothetical protein
MLPGHLVWSPKMEKFPVNSTVTLWTVTILLGLLVNQALSAFPSKIGPLKI